MRFSTEARSAINLRLRPFFRVRKKGKKKEERGSKAILCLLEFIFCGVADGK